MRGPNKQILNQIQCHNHQTRTPLYCLILNFLKLSQIFLLKLNKMQQYQVSLIVFLFSWSLALDFTMKRIFGSELEHRSTSSISYTILKKHKTGKKMFQGLCTLVHFCFQCLFCIMFVVYFDQHLGAAHHKPWLKQSFSAGFLLKKTENLSNLTKQEDSKP